MTKVLVLYYSSYGHIEAMANAVAEGAESVGGANVTIKRVPELVPEDAARKAGIRLDQAAPVAEPAELANYDAIIFGTPTRFGNMAAQMRNFLDQTGGLWMNGALIGKVGSVFASTATQHGGQETTITSFHTDAASPRHGHRRPALLGRRPDDDGRDHRRLALRRDDTGRRRRLAHAQRQRAGAGPFPGPPCRHHRRQVGGLRR